VKTAHPQNRKVAITGLGMITPLGVNTEQCWAGFVQGRSGVGRIRRFDPRNCRTKIAGELPDAYFELEAQAFTPREFRQSTLSSRVTMLVAREALADCGLVFDEEMKQKVAVITGCGGSVFGDEIAFAPSGGLKRKVPIVSHGMLNALSACLTIEYGFQGPSFNVATACASGAHAVGLGFDYVHRTGGMCLVVGVETMVTEETIQGFNDLMALSERNDAPEKASRPFDKLRDGFVLSEGACALFLEPYETALRRGASIYALIVGYAATSEAYNIVAPHMEGERIALTISQALARSQVSKESVGYISAHGTSTYHNDVAETAGIKKVFGDRAYEIPVSSQKSMIGHTIGAAGAIEAAVTALILKHQILTPTINYEVPDPLCDLDYVPNTARPCRDVHVALTNSFGFGGHNCTIVLERHAS